MVPFPANGQPLSDSIFYIVDTPGIEAQQLINNLIDGLRRQYFQRNAASLGRVYVIIAENKNKFRVVEITGTFN